MCIDNDYDGIPNDEDVDDFTGILDSFPDRYSCKNHLCSCIRSDADYSNEGDREKRNNLAEYVVGINLSSKLENLRLGGTLFYTKYNRLIDPYYNFSPDEGDKTAYYFRGKNFFSSNVYFKLYQPIEVFGEVAGTFYRSLSYYPEFNRDFISSIGFSGGVRKKLGDTGFILWGNYIPATIVNPHGIELSDGINNIAGGLFGVYRSAAPKRFIHYIYAYRELLTDDGSDDFERGISYNQRIEFPLLKGLMVKSRQNLELIDHHYYAPDSLSTKITSKISLLYALSELIDSQFILENRFGGPIDGKLKSGVGISTELLSKRKFYGASLLVTYYNTEANRFAYLYPYERSLYNWSFVSHALHGHGFAGSLMYMRYLNSDLVIGVKFKYQIDIVESERSVGTVYLMSQIPF